MSSIVQCVFGRKTFVLTPGYGVMGRVCTSDLGYPLMGQVQTVTLAGRLSICVESSNTWWDQLRGVFPSLSTGSGMTVCLNNSCLEGLVCAWSIFSVPIRAVCCPKYIQWTTGKTRIQVEVWCGFCTDWSWRKVSGTQWILTSCWIKLQPWRQCYECVGKILENHQLLLPG